MRAFAAWRTGLRAALLLARGRAEGVRLLDVGPANAMPLAAWSFVAALICLPGYAGMRGFDWMQEGSSSRAIHGAMAELLAFVVGWAGFALASHRLAAVLHRSSLWPRFIALWNWCNVVQYLLLVVFSIPGLLGAPALINQGAQLVGLGWALWLEWFAFRLTLGIGGIAAAGLVLLDVAIGIVLAAMGAAITAT